MNLVIYKYQLNQEMFDTVEHELPVGYQILRAGFDRQSYPRVNVWILIDLDQEEKIQAKFKIFGTGHKIPSQARYVDTFLDDRFVWHVFDITNVKD